MRNCLLPATKPK
uniref:Uncharacterized protein n=1 Tax=Bursaphelenchus xylophilus TaxID=6326 RepID=A0A1I7SPL0_BURXY